MRLDLAEIDFRQRLVKVFYPDSQSDKSDNLMADKACTCDDEPGIEQIGNGEVQPASAGDEGHKPIDEGEGDENEEKVEEKYDDDDGNENKGEDDPENLEDSLKIIMKLRDRLDNFFPSHD